MTTTIAALAELRAQREAHQKAADDVRDQIYAVIRELPWDCDKSAIARAAGLGRPKVYELMQEG